MRSFNHGCGWLAISAATIGATVCVAVAQAEDLAEQRQNFEIASQPLASALRSYAQQSGDQIVFFSELGQGHDAPSVVGKYTRQEALQLLLQNSGLQYRRLNPKTVAITLAQEETTAGAPSVLDASFLLAQASGLPPAAPHASAAASGTPSEAPADTDDALFGVDQIVVTGTAVSQRTKFESSVAISTFTAEDIQQQAPTSSAELISAVPGFWVEDTAGTTQGNVFARGIIQDGGYRYVGLMEDGIPIYPVFELSFYNPDQFVRVDDTIARVEALRGGTAPIFTSGAIGGSINFVTKRPTDNPEGSFKVGLSDYGTQRADMLWTGPLSDNWGIAAGGYYRRSDGVRDPGYTADKGGQFRVNVLGKFGAGEIELFAKYIDDRSLFVVPIPLQGSPSNPRSLSGDAGTYSLHSEDLARAGLPASAAEVGLEGSDLEDGIHPQLGTVGAHLKWEFNDAVSLSNLIRYTDGEVRFDGIFPGAAPVTGTQFASTAGVAPNYTVLETGEPYAPGNYVQNHGHWVVNKDFEALQNDLRLNFNFGDHALAVGLYAADYSMNDRWSLGNLLLMDVSDQPRRLALPGVTDPSGFTQYSFFNLAADYDAQAYALYASDEWQLTDALRLDFGVRYDTQDIDASISNATTVDLDNNPATLYDNATSLAGTDRTRQDEDFSNTGYSIGFNYEFIPGHALYGHYTDSAKLPHFDDVRNGVLRKDQVTNIELGYKTSIDKLALFATLFQTTFDNVPFTDILANGATVVRQAETRTRGVELEGEYRPIDPLNVRFSITRQDPEYQNFSGATVDNTGNTIRRIPKLMVKINPTFSFMQERARAYLTYTYVGERYSNDENTIELPSYYKLDAGFIFEMTNQWTLQITGDNLTDEVGLTEGNPRTDVGADGLDGIYMARPLFGRSVQGSVTFKF